MEWGILLRFQNVSVHVFVFYYNGENNSRTKGGGRCKVANMSVLLKTKN